MPRINNQQSPVHPGEILYEEFLKPLSIATSRLARDTGISVQRVANLLKGKSSITAETALRLARYFGTTERFWLNLQTHYDLEVVKDRLGDRLQQEVAVFVPTEPVPL
jgi:addiction module HigA family antidote